ncbi:MAG: DUF2480 family protein [Chitinophagaceae bacterium]
MSDQIINKVAESGLLTVDPATYFPKGATAVFDLKDHLFMGLILKEKDFREALKKNGLGTVQRKKRGADLFGGCHHSGMGVYAGGFLPAAGSAGSSYGR